MAKTKTDSAISIKNRKASYNYEFLEEFNAGIVLMGTEIKSIRQGKVTLGESYCFIDKGEIFIKNMHITEYENGGHYNHEPLRVRKLLLQKREIGKLENKLKDQGLTIVVSRIYITKNGLAKLNIALARGKKLHDKRDSIKSKDIKRELERTQY